MYHCIFQSIEPSHGRTGLHLAACANDDVTIKHLISYGADCNQTDLEGRTPYMKAAEYGHVQALKALLEGALNPDLSRTLCLLLLFYF